MLPDQFWQLTPREFWLKYKGWQRRRNRQRYDLGTAISWLAQPYSKKPLNPQKVMGPIGPILPAPPSAETE